MEVYLKQRENSLQKARKLNRGRFEQHATQNKLARDRAIRNRANATVTRLSDPCVRVALRNYLSTRDKMSIILSCKDLRKQYPVVPTIFYDVRINSAHTISPFRQIINKS